jgi:hypothetical protein
MKRLLLSLSLAALTLLASLASADETRWDILRVYNLADGRGVAVAVPGEWQVMDKNGMLEAGAPARFIDESGRRVIIPAATLERAAESKAIARPPENRKLALRTH